MKKKQDTKGKGRIQVTVQREDRLATIGVLAHAIDNLTEALRQPVKVDIINNVISNVDMGINLNAEDKITRTEIREIEVDT